MGSRELGGVGEDQCLSEHICFISYQPDGCSRAGVAGVGVDRYGVSIKDMFGFPVYRDERTCVCQIASP